MMQGLLAGPLAPSSTAAGSAAEAGLSTEGRGGVLLPQAADWLDFWQNSAIPQQRTFIDFAEAVHEQQSLRRVHSSPNIISQENDQCQDGSEDDHIIRL